MNPIVRMRLVADPYWWLLKQVDGCMMNCGSSSKIMVLSIWLESWRSTMLMFLQIDSVGGDRQDRRNRWSGSLKWQSGGRSDECNWRCYKSGNGPSVVALLDRDMGVWVECASSNPCCSRNTKKKLGNGWLDSEIQSRNRQLDLEKWLMIQMQMIISNINLEYSSSNPKTWLDLANRWLESNIQFGKEQAMHFGFASYRVWFVLFRTTWRRSCHLRLAYLLNPTNVLDLIPILNLKKRQWWCGINE